MKRARPHRLAGHWYLIRRVPKVFQHLDKRKIVRMATGIPIEDDPRGIRAQRAVDKLNEELEAYWRSLFRGETENAKQRYQDARTVARALGIDYMPAPELAQRDVTEIVRRFLHLNERNAVEDEAKVAAVLGGIEKPKLRLSSLFEEFEALSRAELAQMSPDQVRKWRNPKKRALKNLLDVVGDKAINDLTRSDALDFRDWWQERIVNEDVEIATANKDFGHINKMLRKVDEVHRLGLAPVFGSLRIAGGTVGSRKPYPTDFLQEHILAEGMFEDINPEARRVLYLMVETGLRPVEAVNLTPTRIFLDAPIPFIRIAPEGRRLKTMHSEREIPLVGVSLMVMKLQPEGFPRYRDKSASLSADINKALANRNLRPVEGQSLYSLRHSFEDRLTAVEAPEKVIASLMGHKWQRPKYGAGPSLDQKRDWLNKIALRPPLNI